MTSFLPSKPAHVNGEPRHVIFAGGGTGGHLFPGLAVAEELRRRRPDLHITFVGSGKAFEREWVASAEFDYVVLPCSPLPRRFWHLPGFLLDNAAGYRAATRLLREKRPSVVVGLGGYASVPVARAARRNGAKLVLLEQNVVPGRANRWLARTADAVCVAFPGTVERLSSRGEILITGTPIRPGFTHAAPARNRRRLLVLGGSGGARSLNQQVPLALYRVRQHIEGGEIVHQAGEADLVETRRLYDKLGMKADVVPFIVDMPRILGWTGLAVSRAGGSALAELAAAGVPAILLPYPHAVNDHQLKNAELFRDSGGCVLIDSREYDGQIDHPLADALGAILSDSLRRERLSYTIQRLARPDAARDVANVIMRLVADKPLPLPLPCQATRPTASVTPPPLKRAPRLSHASETDRKHEYSLL